jgi:hypothetical protein
MKILSTLILVCASMLAKAQFLYPYSFVDTNATYTNLANPTIITTPDWDDTLWVLPIGFNFKWATQTRIVDSLLLDSYGAVNMPKLGNVYDTFLTFFLTRSGMIPYGADMCDRSFNDTNNAAMLSTIGYSTTGTIGSRIFKIEFNNVGFYSDTSGTDFAHVQMWLYEGSNIIEYRYGPSRIYDNNVAFDGSAGPNVALVYTSSLDINAQTFTIDSSSYVRGDTLNYTYKTVGQWDPFIAGPPNDFYLDGSPNNGRLFRFIPYLETAIDDLSKTRISIYPTKFDHSIYVEGIANAQATLLDAAGHIVAQLHFTNGKFDVSSIAAGHYVLQIQADGKHYSFRVQK